LQLTDALTDDPDRGGQENRTALISLGIPKLVRFAVSAKSASNRLWYFNT
jgi:hypothetical protein